MARHRLASGATLLFANLSEMLFPFIRSAVLARLLTTEQMGLAISLTVVASAAEIMTDIGVPYSAVRAEFKVPAERVYSTLQSIQLLRGTLIGLCIAAAAPLVVMAFDSEHALWAFMLLGLSAFIRSFAHLGTKERMRHYVFWPEAATIIGAQVAWTLVSIAFAWWTRDFSAMIWGVLGSAATTVLLTHLFANRPWKLGWDRQVARDSFRYGRPLIPNGMANALNVMGDRFIVGAQLGVAPLALYNIAMTTAVLPRGALLKVMNSFFLPVFVNYGPPRAKSEHLFDFWALCLALIGLACGIGLISIGRPMIGLIFGGTYQPSELLMSLIAVDVCIKFLNGLPVPPSLAYGQTAFVLKGSVATCLSVVFAGVLLYLLPSIEGFVFALALGEFLALMWITWRTIRIHAFTPSLTWFVVLWPIGVLSALSGAHVAFAGLSLVTWVAISWSVGVVAIAIMVGVLHWRGVSLFRLLGMRRSAGSAPVSGLAPEATPGE